VICDHEAARIFQRSTQHVSLRGSRPFVSRANPWAHVGWPDRRAARSSRDIETRSFPHLLAATLAALPSMSQIPSTPLKLAPCPTRSLLPSQFTFYVAFPKSSIQISQATRLPLQLLV